MGGALVLVLGVEGSMGLDTLVTPLVGTPLLEEPEERGPVRLPPPTAVRAGREVGPEGAVPTDPRTALTTYPPTQTTRHHLLST